MARQGIQAPPAHLPPLPRLPEKPVKQEPDETHSPNHTPCGSLVSGQPRRVDELVADVPSGELSNPATDIILTLPRIKETYRNPCAFSRRLASCRSAMEQRPCKLRVLSVAETKPMPPSRTPTATFLSAQIVLQNTVSHLTLSPSLLIRLIR